MTTQTPFDIEAFERERLAHKEALAAQLVHQQAHDNAVWNEAIEATAAWLQAEADKRGPASTEAVIYRMSAGRIRALKRGKQK